MAKANYKDAAMRALGAGAGVVAVGLLATKVPFVKDQKPAVQGAVAAVAGIALSAFMGKKNKFIDNLGIGMAAAGVARAASAVVPGIAGDEDWNVYGVGEDYLIDETVSGIGENEMIAGDALIAGADDDVPGSSDAWSG